MPRPFRYWKQAFEPDFVEGGHYDHKLGISEKQRKWLKRCWGFYSYYMQLSLLPRDQQPDLNTIIAQFNPDIHKPKCVLPLFNEEKDKIHLCWSSKDINMHHWTPKGHELHKGQTMDVDNMPNMFVPVCAYHHTGRGYQLNGTMPHDFDELTAQDLQYQEMLHPDTCLAFEYYANGNQNGFDAMNEFRERVSQDELLYWNTQYDVYFARKAEEAVSLFAVLFQEPFPQRI